MSKGRAEAVSPLARRLARARRTGRFVGAVSAQQAPADLEGAYAVAGELTALLGARVAGYKLGATSARARAMLGLREPFWGAIFEGEVFESPALLAPLGTPLEVEPEIAFRLARDISPDEVIEPAAIPGVAGAAYVALEINRPSYRRPFVAGALCIIADKGANWGCVLGPRLDPREELAEVELQLRCTDRAADASTARLSGFDPIATFGWFLNAAARGGVQLRAGQIVTTGAIGRPLKLAAGERATVFAHGAEVLTLHVGGESAH